MAFSVAQRSHEIALRMALGAIAGRVVGLVVREGVILAAIGLGLGLVGAYFVGRAMQSMLFGVRPLDVLAFLVGGIGADGGGAAGVLFAGATGGVDSSDAGAEDGVRQLGAGSGEPVAGGSEPDRKRRTADSG